MNLSGFKYYENLPELSNKYNKLTFDQSSLLLISGTLSSEKGHFVVLGTLSESKE